MDNVILNSYSKINNLNVSRETCNELEMLISMIQKKNKEINIISRNFFEKQLKIGSTTRNWKTVMKLAELSKG